MLKLSCYDRLWHERQPLKTRWFGLAPVLGKYIILFILVNYSFFAFGQEEITTEQTGNKIGMKQLKIQGKYHTTILFNGAEKKLTTFESAYFSPNRELAAIHSPDIQFIYPTTKTFNELVDTIRFFDFQGNLIKTMYSKSIRSLVIDNNGDLIMAERIRHYLHSQYYCNLKFYKYNEDITWNDSTIFVDAPDMYFLNDSLALVYGPYKSNSNDSLPKILGPNKNFMVLFKNFSEVGRLEFEELTMDYIHPMFPMIKPEIAEELIKIHCLHIRANSKDWLRTNDATYDSIILYINMKGEIKRREETW
jgi:hypothetical protein